MDATHFANRSSLVIPKTQVLPENAQIFWHQNYPVIELLIMLPFYSMFFSNTLSYLRGFPKSRKGVAHGYPPRILTLHILTSLFYNGRYYIRSLFAEQHAERLDLALGIVEIMSAWLMTKWSRSKSAFGKASFQTMALMIAIPVLTAYTTSSTQWHRTTVKCIEWFVTYRWVSVAISKYHILGYPRVPYDALVHLVSVPLTLCLADWTSAIPLYLVAASLMMLLEEWVTKQVPHKYVRKLPLPFAPICSDQSI